MPCAVCFIGNNAVCLKLSFGFNNGLRLIYFGFRPFKPPFEGRNIAEISLRLFFHRAEIDISHRTNNHLIGIIGSFYKPENILPFYFFYLFFGTEDVTAEAVSGKDFFLYLVAGFWLLPRIATEKAGPALSQMLGTSVTTGKITFNPLTFELTVPDIDVPEKPGGPSLLKMGALYVDFSPLRSLFHRAIVLQELRLKHPQLHIAIDSNGTFNFAPILAHLQRQSGDAGASEKTHEEMPRLCIRRSCAALT